MTKRLLLGFLGAPLLAALHGAPTTFRVDPGARPALRELWAASVAAKAERVACLASVVEGDTLRITRIQPLSGGADSMAVSALASLETCGPPAWQGTVHTHIAVDGNRQPFARFSGSDRGVMLMWWQRWKTDGTFCLLYAEDQAHCEIDGSGLVILPSARY
ncbi:MAG TPA: hypothetical protein VFG66_12145 [Gemmatimonadales bacterium]|nr:hypothetical protein [Gemmatimonadales bacterium]